MRLTIFGAGYVGLVTGAGLSDLGHDVLVFDIDEEKIRKLEGGHVPIYEPGLGDLIARNRKQGRLRFASKLEPLDDVDAYFIAVGTPPAPDGSADLTAVMSVANMIAKTATTSALVVVKSTVPVGTCDAVQLRLRESAVSLEVVSNPEFLKEGEAVNDFFKPDRVVVGVSSASASARMRELYAPLQLSGERPMIVTDPRSSELIKYAANTMLAVRISFMNELARLCDAAHANIHAVRLGVGADSRIGKKFLYAGPGYGGSCFPKDVQALAALGRSHGLTLRLAEAAHTANEEQSQYLADVIGRALGANLAGKRVAIWGLAFKPETDDVRESPAIKLTRALLAAGALVVGHDPEAGPNFRREFAIDDRVRVAERDYDALDGAHALVLLTEWRSYRAPNFAEIRRRMAGGSPLVFDARNVWRPEFATAAGLAYRGIGAGAKATSFV